MVIGFGWCGRGLAARARGMGARVVVCEVDPRRALEAVMEGYQVLPVAEAARVGEVSVTVTGNRTQALAVERLATAADPSRRACTRSRPRRGPPDRLMLTNRSPDGRGQVGFPAMTPLAAASLAGLLGLAAGSVANVVIDLVPRREPLARPGSRCPSCGARVAWRDNVPVVGWLLRRGRCRACRAPISPRYPLVELATGLLWFLLTLRLVAAGLGWAVPAYLALAFVCLVLAVIDASTRLLPNRITYPAFPVLLGLLLVASLGLGDLGRLARGLLAAAAVGAFFLLLALISPRGMGLGDVKLAPTLGLALGWLSWGTVAVGVFAGFLLGGLAGVAAILVLGLTRKSLLPFGPWLVAGALLGVLAGGDVAAWYARALIGS